MHVCFLLSEDGYAGSSHLSLLIISHLISVCRCRHSSTTKSYSDHHTCPLIVDHPASVKSIILVAGPRRVQSGICLQQVGASCRIITPVASSLQRPIGCIGALVPPVLHHPSLPITLFDDPVGRSLQLILLCRQTYLTIVLLPSQQEFEECSLGSSPWECVSAGG